MIYYSEANHIPFTEISIVISNFGIVSFDDNVTFVPNSKGGIVPAKPFIFQWKLLVAKSNINAVTAA
jgi:hypothetical protein